MSISESHGPLAVNGKKWFKILDRGRSGSVVNCLTREGPRLEPHRRHCVVVLEQDTFILA